MLFSHDDNCVAVECGDTSTTLVVDLRNGFCLTLSGEEWVGESMWDEVPVRWSCVPGFSGTLPEAILAPLQMFWARRDLDKVESRVYTLAHSIADDDYDGFADWIEDFLVA